MLKLHGMTLIIALAALLGACEDPTDPIGPAEAHDDELVALLSTEGGSDPGDAGGDATSSDTRTRGGGSGLFDRLAAEIDGFGGLYRERPCAVAVVLTDRLEAEHAVRVVKRVVEPLVQRSCPTGIRVRAVGGHFTYRELKAFLSAAQRLVQQPGVHGASIDFKANKVVILVESREVGARVLEALGGLGIREAAVLIKLHRR